MTPRRNLWLWAAAAATPLSLAIGGWWHSRQEPQYVARARVVVPGTHAPPAEGDHLPPGLEDSLLSPEIIVSATGLLRERGVALKHRSSRESEINYLTSRLSAGVEHQPHCDDVDISFVTTDAEGAVPVLTAVVDAAVSAWQIAHPEIVDPAEVVRRQQGEQLAQAIEQQRACVAELEQQFAQRDASIATAAPDGDISSLTAAVDAARQQRLEAEVCLAETRRKIRAGVTVEEILSQLPRGPGWEPTRELFGAAYLQRELRQQEAAVQAASNVYGRNHPRMATLRAQVDLLRQKLEAIRRQAAAPPPGQSLTETSTGTSAGSAPLAATELLLKTLADKVQQAHAAEQSLESKLAAHAESAARRHEFDEKLAASRVALESLRNDYAGVRRAIANAEREAASRRPGVIEPPALSPEPIVASLTGYLLWSGVIGLATSGACWRQFRRVAPAIGHRPASHAAAKGAMGATGSEQREPAVHVPLDVDRDVDVGKSASQSVAGRIEPLRAQEADNLARLKRLKRAA